MFKCSLWLFVAATCVLTVPQVAHAQDQTHYLPPLYSRSSTSSNALPAAMELVLTTNEVATFDVFCETGDGTPIPGSPFTIAANSPSVVALGGGASFPGFRSGSAASGPLNTPLPDAGIKCTASAAFFTNIRAISEDDAQAMSLTGKGRVGLGTDFRTGHYKAGGNTASNSLKSHFASVMATQDNTTVNITEIKTGVVFDGTPAAGAPLTSAPISVVLNQGESYIVAYYFPDAAAGTDDMNGTRITSDKPIAVTTGSWLGGAKLADGGRDIAVDQTIPASELRDQYLVFRGAPAAEAAQLERPLIVATQSNTDIFVNGAVVPSNAQPLQPGDYFFLGLGDFDATTGIMWIELRDSVSGAPRGGYLYQSTNAALNGNGPTMGVVPGAPCLSSTRVEIEDINYYGGHELQIVARTGATVNVTDDTGAVALPAPDSPTGTGAWMAYRMSGLTGDVAVDSNLQFFVTTTATHPVQVHRGVQATYTGFANAPLIINPVALATDTITYPVLLSLEQALGIVPDSFQWFLDGVAIPGATGDTHFASGPGTYTVTGTTADCGTTPISIAVTLPGELELSKEVVSMTQAGDSTYDITYRFTAENFTANTVSNVRITDALDVALAPLTAGVHWSIGAGPTVSGDFAAGEENATFDGVAASDIDLLDAGVDLASREVGIVELTLRVDISGGIPSQANVATITEGSGTFTDTGSAPFPPPNPLNVTVALGAATNVGGNTWDLPYIVSVTNETLATPATNVQLVADMEAALAPLGTGSWRVEVAPVGSGAFAPTESNASFDGEQGSELNLLDLGVDLLPGETGTIGFTIRLNIGGGIPTSALSVIGSADGFSDDVSDDLIGPAHLTVDGPDADVDPTNDPTAVNIDTDGDTDPDLTDPDDDNDGVGDATDPARADPDVCGDSDGDTCDDCAVGTDNFGAQSDQLPSNDGQDTDGDGLCDAGDPDDDDDGVCDGAAAVATVCTAGPDVDPLDPSRCQDTENDGCDDCTNVMTGGGDTTLDGPDRDADRVCNVGDPDDDNDGVPDVSDPEEFNPDICGDSDGDTCDDCVIGTDGLGVQSDSLPNNDGQDTDADGLCDAGDPDDDDDGVCDGAAAVAGVCTAGPDVDPLDPSRCQDVDGDTCDDCANVMTGGGDPANDGTDSNGDGTCDAAPTTDLDGDGIDDVDDIDDDNDGIPDAVEGSGDTDGDGVPDARDLDADNDGIFDVVEAGHDSADADGDGQVDCNAGYDAADNGLCDDLETTADDGVVDYDSDGNGPDAPIDTDGDGQRDFQDLDADDDGIPDVAEGGSGCTDVKPVDAVCDLDDKDGDGIAESIDDVGGFGDAAASAPTDSNGDGIADFQSLDADGDGIDDRTEGGSGCTDTTPADGMCDGNDGDSDGIVDDIDNAATFGDPGALTPTESDGDGVDDYQDLDADNDGILDRVEGTVDTDGDLVPDYLDLDSDNDGIFDVVEGLSGCSDTTAKDGRCDGPFDGNGVATDATNQMPPDTDGDGASDFRDLDSDNDGAPDVIEGGSGCTDTTPMDAVCDAPVRRDGVPSTAAGTDPPDSDGDSVFDYRDLDSDNDGRSDLVEVASGCTDSDENAVCDRPDTDGDGIVDSIDDSVMFGDSGSTTPADDDGVGEPDYLDLDSDGDGTPDVATSTCSDTSPADDRCDGSDRDGDGGVDDIDDFFGFGFGGDSDGDGVDDADDIDDDNDGIPDADEGDTTVDTDGDGVPDSLDLDSDNDGLPDVVEAGHGLEDANGDGTVDCPGGFGVNGLCDGLETAMDTGSRNYTIADTDQDGVRDFRDLDSDNDGITDLIEGDSGCTDTQMADAVCDGPDADRDGVVDSIDQTSGFGVGGYNAPPNTDGEGAPDYRDLDSDNDGIDDVEEGGHGSLDGDNDGEVDGSDDDGDGVIDEVDGSASFGVSDASAPPNTDSTGLPDYRDLDSDDDGLTDEVEGQPGDDPPDTDGDGIPDYQDVDSDDDSITDGSDNCRLVGNTDQFDEDADGLGQVCDSDDNGDGFDDGLGISGGGCASSSQPFAVWLLLGLMVFVIGRRRRLGARS